MLKNIKLTTAALISLITLVLIGCGSSSSDVQTNDARDTTNSIDLTTYAKTPLTDEQKYALAYMWNEERLAYDIYTNLNAINPVIQLEKISSNSEVIHIELVKDLAEWYDINITNLVDYTESYSEAELEAMPSGTYGIQAIQDLYNELYDYGVASVQASLEVGCKVEVVDINDLDAYIEDSIGNQALIDTFNVLRDGSYKHYWSFDDGLKNLGIIDGCCSLGNDFCKPDYPKN